MRRKLSVLHVSRFYFDRGGAQACYMALGRLLQEHGHEVIPFAGRHPHNEFTPFEKYFVNRFADFDLHSLSLWDKLLAGSKAIYAFDVVRNIEELVREHRPDIADVHNIFYQITPSAFRPIRRAGIPVIHHLHDYAMFCINGVMEAHGKVCERCCGHRYYNAIIHKCYHGSALRSLIAVSSKVLNKLLRLYDPYVDRYIVTSNFQKKLMVRWGLPEHRMVVIPLFFDGSRYPTVDGALEKKRVVYFGEMKERKGPHVLLEAARHFPDYEFVFVGAGPMRKILAERASGQGMRNAIFHDFLPKESLFKIIQEASCTVMPSIFYESFGRVIIESFYYGKPVIGARIGSIPEVIQDGVNGLLFKPGDSEDLAEKLALILEDDERRMEMGRLGRLAVAERYSKDLYYERLMAVYAKAIKLGHKPARRI